MGLFHGWGAARGLARTLACRLALALAAGVLACGGPQRPRSVVLVLLDTVRADRLGCYGNPRGLTPRLDAFAGESVLFENATAHAPWTLPSTASIYTGLYPPRHGAGGHLPTLTQLSASATTLAEVARSGGLRSHAIVNVSFLAEPFGLARGFDTLDASYFESNEEVRRAGETVDRACEWIAQHGDEPYFLVVHLFDAHAVYDPPPPFRERFARPEDAHPGSLAFGSMADIVALRTGRAALDPATIQRAEALYDGEVAYVDHEVGRLLDFLDGHGGKSAVVAITSDHGEEFLDHGGFEHGHSLHAELLHVPLIVRGAELGSGLRVGEAVAHVDLAPTLCELAGLATPSGLDGASLVPLVRESRDAGRAALAIGNFWGPPLASLRARNEKLIVYPQSSGRSPELYDWRGDPRELRDLSAERRDRSREMQRRLHALLTSLDLKSDPARAAQIDAATRRELESLGYTDSADPAKRGDG